MDYNHQEEKKVLFKELRDLLVDSLLILEVIIKVIKRKQSKSLIYLNKNLN